MIDIVGIGACVMDTLMVVPEYPQEDTKMRAVEVRQSGGGPCCHRYCRRFKAGCFIGVSGCIVR